MLFYLTLNPFPLGRGQVDILNNYTSNLTHKISMFFYLTLNPFPGRKGL
jgi:hypothetical protein